MFHLIIATPEKRVFEGEIVSLKIPGSAGYMEILTNHAPLATSLKPGIVSFVAASGEKYSYHSTSGGLFQVIRNQVLLLPDQLSNICDTSKETQQR